VCFKIDKLPSILLGTEKNSDLIQSLIKRLDDQKSDFNILSEKNDIDML